MEAIINPLDQKTTLNDIHVDTPLIEMLLAHILHLPELFLAAKANLKPEHFDGRTEFSYRTVWQCALQHYTQFNQYPTCEILSAMAMSFIRADGFAMPEQVEDVRQLLEWIFSPRWQVGNELQVDAGYFVLQRFLHERMIEYKFKKVFETAGGPTVGQLNKLLTDSVDALSRIQALDSVTLVHAMPDNFERPAAMLLPTRIQAIDTHMGDGSQLRETNILLAPSGVGKTMTGFDIACGRAEAQWEAEQAQPGSGKAVVYCTYEEDMEMVQPRIWARAAQINIEEARKMRSMREMSTTGKLKEYEQQEFRDLAVRGIAIPGEYERYQTAKPVINKFLHVGDFSGAKVQGQKSRGYGGVEEISQYLDMLTNQLQMGVDTVIIDWAGMAVRRQLQAKGKDDQIAGALNSYVDQVYGLIAGRFNCVSWVLHQIAGRYNNKPPTFDFHHSHAEWCSSFAVNAWFAFTLSTKSGRHCVLRCTKARRGEPKDRQSVCRIDGAYGRLVADPHYVIDNLSNAIVARSDISRFVGDAAMPRNRDLE
jgi:hypothetical protein